MTGRWFSPGTLASSTNKTGRHDITGILLKVALNTINHKPILGQYTRTYGHKIYVLLRQKSPVRTNIYLIHYSDWHFFFEYEYKLMLKSLMAIRQKMHVYGSHLPCVTIPINLKTNTTDIILIASIARCELNSRGDESIYTINTNRKWILSFGIEWTIGVNYRK